MKAHKTLISLTLVSVFHLILAGQLSLGARTPKCPPAREKEMDLCAAKMGFLGDRSFKVPTNQSDMNNFCNQLKQSLNCLQSYSRDCIDGFSRQILSSLLKRGKQQFSSICADTNSREEFLTKMACLSGDKIEGIFTSMDSSIARYEMIAGPEVHHDDRLPAICCSYHLFEKDINSSVIQACGKQARGKGSTGEYLKKIVSGTTSQFLGLICDAHKSIADCRTSTKTNKTMVKLEEITDKVTSGKLHPKSKSLVPVLLDILDASD